MENDKKALEAERPKLAEDILAMRNEGKPNLWRRHKESIASFRENEFAEAFCRIKPNQAGSRRPALDRFEALGSDEEFEQAMYLLECNKFMEWVQRAHQNLGRIERKEFKELSSILGTLGAAMKRGSSATAATARTLAPRAGRTMLGIFGELDDIIGGFLENHGGKK